MVKAENVIMCFLLLLGTDKYITAVKVADKLGVCYRTALRYLETLELIIPIECNRGGGG